MPKPTRTRSDLADAARVFSTGEYQAALTRFRDGARPRGLEGLEQSYREAPPGDERAQAAYWSAWAAYAERRFDVAERWLARALDEARGSLYARGLALSGWVAEARGDFGAATRAYRLALGALRERTERDDELAVAILRTLGSLAVELGDTELADYVAAQARGVTGADAVLRFQLDVQLGLAALNRGDVDGALDRLDAAEHAASRSALRAHAMLERAEIYRLLDEPTAARRLVARAVRELGTVDWATAEVEDLSALLESVVLAARFGEPAATEWLARYFELAGAGDAAFVQDPRVHAREVHARAATASEDAERARLLRDALDRWESLRYVRRALTAAAELAARGERIESARLRALVDALPTHPLAQQLQRRLGSAELGAGGAVVLSPEQRRVLEALCAGVSVRTMAQEWGRSEFTIRNHLKKLFAKLQVVSSAALVAKAMSSGIVGAAPKVPPARPPRGKGGAQEG
ncbi:MAG TPA: LuxR C-terminal-related transcriptional regulator [Candidatus Sulfotelmatobacter sp.]|nr:LuxR C-terminal-related transcriptional regulator [Candidatus Sulfotelmatobacter sp.]